MNFLKNIEMIWISIKSRDFIIWCRDSITFFEESNMSIGDDHQIETFASVVLKSSDIVRAIKNFHGKPMFSNVTISAKDEEKNGVT